jgi:cytochrome c553
MPSLAGQPPIYTQTQLMRFRDGRRRNDQMTAFVARLTDTDIADLAAFYATQRPRRRTVGVEPPKVEAGQKAAVTYQCTACHLADFRGHEHAPRLAGQDLAYLRKAIRAFKDKIAADADGRMTIVAMPLTDDDIEALAHFLASLGER